MFYKKICVNAITEPKVLGFMITMVLLKIPCFVCSPFYHLCSYIITLYYTTYFCPPFHPRGNQIYLLKNITYGIRKYCSFLISESVFVIKTSYKLINIHT